MQAGTIDRLLRQRYKDKHIVVSEMQGVTGNGRLDFVAIRASWTHPDVEAHEIKVSRRDFLQDDKWAPYLDSCHLFWFVTAPDVILNVDEVPAQAGWLEASKNGAKLFVRKKAPRREMSDQQQAKLFRQLLHRYYYTAPGSGMSKEERTDWMDRYALGLATRKDVANRVRARILSELRTMEQRAATNEAEMEALKAFRDALLGLGVEQAHLDRIASARTSYGVQTQVNLLIEKKIPEAMAKHDKPLQDSLQKVERVKKQVMSLCDRITVELEQLHIDEK